MSSKSNTFMPTGKLDIIIGPMFSGKSSELLRRLVISSQLGLKVLYVNHSLDNRSGTNGEFSTHHPFLSVNGKSAIDFETYSSLRGVRKEEYDVIGIDEAQFFDDSLIEFSRIHADSYKRHVIVCGLDGNAERKKFGHILDLIPLCDTIKKLRPFCADCAPSQSKACFSFKFTSFDSPSTVEIGGSDKYKPLCRNCYLNNA